MINSIAFAAWLKVNTSYSAAVVSDTLSRIKRADGIMSYTGEETYLFYLERQQIFQSLSVSVRSQIRKAVKLYMRYDSENK